MAKKTTTDKKDVTAEATTTESKVKTLPGGVTQEQIDDWKEQHEGVYIVEAYKPSGEKLTGYVHDVNSRKLRKSILRNIGMGDAQTGGELVIKNCWLGGDEAIKTDQKLFEAAALAAIEALDMREATARRLT